MKTYQAEIIRQTLKLVGEDLPLEVITEWTPKQVDQAERWAANYYAKHIDNLRNTRVPPKPGFLTQRAPDKG